jgi:hypothetical protein
MPQLQSAIKEWSIQKVIEERTQKEAWAEWALTSEPGLLAPDTLPQTKERPPLYGIVAFARGCMP